MQVVEQFRVNASGGAWPARQPRDSGRQGRTFGPFWGVLLTNILASIVAAQFAALEYEARPWIAYNGPAPPTFPPAFASQWYPIEGPPATTAGQSPYPAFATPPAAPADFPPYGPVPGAYGDYSGGTGSAGELEAAGSNVNLRGQPPHGRRQAPARRGQQGGGGGRPRWWRTTTPQYDYYGEYDEYDYAPERRRRRPALPGRPYDSAEYGADREPPAKPARRQRPNNKRREELLTPSYQDVDPATEIVIVRQRQQTAAPTTTTEEATTTSTAATTSTTEGTTTSATTTAANATGYGYYGPSNGNEGISFTYGPPYRFQYSAPNWYSRPEGRSATVQRLQ